VRMNVKAEPPDFVNVHRLTKGACMRVLKPCGITDCRYHLTSEVRAKHLARADLAEPCSLKLANGGGMTLDDVGRKMGVTRERTRQIETIALRNLARAFRLTGWSADEVRAVLDVLGVT
jgi:hypothetical protein